MANDRLKTIIREFHELPLPDLVERPLDVDITLLNASVKKIFTIIGPRRAGKTYFLFQIMKHLQELNNGGQISI